LTNLTLDAADIRRKGSAKRRYSVKEVFTTIQGEGHYAGTSSLFVRFAGCNLSCSFCDTDFKNGTSLSLEQLEDCIVDVLKTHFHKYGNFPVHCVFTGGEPAVQLSREVVSLVKSAEMFRRVLPPRMHTLLRDGAEISRISTTAIETNGTIAFDKEGLGLDWVTCSPKPTEGPEATVTLCFADELKYVIGETNPLPDIENLPNGLRKARRKLVSPMADPVSGEFYPMALHRCVEWVWRHPQWNVSLQTHKVLGVD